jgi:AcrR family transcriptional regulator
LAKAVALFWKRGYEATSVSDLKKALGIESPSLYAAFGSKEDLFRECVERYSREYLAGITGSMERAATARAGIEAVLTGLAAHYAGAGHPKGCLVVSGAVNCGPEARRIEAELRRRRAAGAELMQRRIERGVAPGEFRSAVDCGALSEFFATVLLGMAQRARDGASREELERIAALSLSRWPE